MADKPRDVVLANSNRVPWLPCARRKAFAALAEKPRQRHFDAYSVGLCEASASLTFANLGPNVAADGINRVRAQQLTSAVLMRFAHPSLPTA